MVPNSEARYRKLSALIERRIADETVLVPVAQTALEMNKIYTLDEVGTRIWELLDGQRTMRDIRSVILDEYDVTDEQLDADLDEFVEQLLAIGAIEAA